MCSDDQYSWMKYVVITFVPLTVFLVLVLCCRIMQCYFTSAECFITFSKALAFPANVCPIILASNDCSYYKGAIVRLVLAIHSLWNLDFFCKFILHTVCQKVDALQALALDYSIAFYPLALIIIGNILIELHAHNFRVLVWIWRPFHRCFARFRQQWDIRTFIIDPFAIFLILSNIKL